MTLMMSLKICLGRRDRGKDKPGPHVGHEAACNQLIMHFQHFFFLTKKADWHCGLSLCGEPQFLGLLGV